MNEEDSRSLRAVLIYSSLKADFQDIVAQTKRRASEDYMVEVRDALQLTPEEEQRFLDDIRAIAPQVRGQVKSGRERTLPISHSGKLSRSIPILLFYQGSKPVDVYPKVLMGIMNDIHAAFKIPKMAEVLGLESTITTLLLSRPQLLGPNLELVGRELETKSGTVDLVFKDRDGVHVAVEVKHIADQETVGQILKQSNGMKDKLGLTTVRKVIVALGVSGSVREACQDAGVELYLLSTNRQV
jgi:hypothetical protein